MLSVLRCARAVRERDWLMILVAFWHGLRASEVVGFQRDAVQDGYITIQRRKGSLRTVQPLIEHSEPLLSERAALIDFAQKSSFDRSIFDVSRVQFFRIFRRHAKAAGIPRHKCHPHVLKHSIAMELVDVIGVPKLKAYLGHKSGSSTLEYTKPQEEEVNRAVADAIKVL